ncbi:MAG: pantoate--beta-alanine ligase [Candidatus Omnitrophica bacterium]|nr:pantoate--beta-alanine ligase [Candidatus Omnitrophota bacterium]
MARSIHLQRKSVGFVSTMGYLHQGHLSLIQKARRENDFVVVSIFVNPIQFGPKEDFQRYPRDLKRDVRLCKKAGVDVIFYPHAQDMYSKNFKTYVVVEELSDKLCGSFRPGHFKGVTTVVAKLFNIVQPDIAYFGQKDAQQAIIIKRMVKDLNIPVRIRVLPIVRESDGLAMSSRNVYLNEDERRRAVIIYNALRYAQDLVRKKTKNSSFIINRVKNIIKPKVDKIDYIEIVDLEELLPVDKIKGKVLLAIAVRIGKTRLIDNSILKLP